MLPWKSVNPNFVACFVLFGIAFSFMKLISSSDTSTKREAAVLKICPPAIITSPEVIIVGYDAILSQWECANFYNHLSNCTKVWYCHQNMANSLQYIVVGRCSDLWTKWSGFEFQLGQCLVFLGKTFYSHSASPTRCRNGYYDGLASHPQGSRKYY